MMHFYSLGFGNEVTSSCRSCSVDLEMFGGAPFRKQTNPASTQWGNCREREVLGLYQQTCLHPDRPFWICEPKFLTVARSLVAFWWMLTMKLFPDASARRLLYKLVRSYRKLLEVIWVLVFFSVFFFFFFFFLSRRGRVEKVKSFQSRAYTVIARKSMVKFFTRRFLWRFRFSN